MNISMFHWGFPPIIGGAETHLSLLCPEMVKKGHDVSLLTGSAPKVKSEYTYKGVNIKRTNLMDLNWLARRGLEGLRYKIDEMFYNFVKETKPNIIHAHNMHWFSETHTYALERIAKERKIPLILTAHNVWSDGLYLRLAMDTKWTKIICVSDYIKRELRGLGIIKRRLETVPHGIDLENFKKKRNHKNILKQYPELEGKRIILHPARLCLDKGGDVAVKALRLIKKKYPDIMMILCGTRNTVDWEMKSEKDIAYIVQLINRLGLDKNVLTESFPRDKMVDLYQMADFCIYPSSFQEPFGVAMLESAACAKPMIVTRAGGMPEFIQDGVNGYVINMMDYRALAKRSLTLLKDAEERKEMGRAGLELVKENHRTEQMTQKTLDVYNSTFYK